MTWNDVLLLKHFHLTMFAIADGFAFIKNDPAGRFSQDRLDVPWQSLDSVLTYAGGGWCISAAKQTSLVSDHH